MRFRTSQDVLNWYEGQPRFLDDKFISTIPWNEVRNYEFDVARFAPILMYMRDIEILTDMYHKELLRTPTGSDPIIGRFMERWGVEEITHGELINRFLEEVGVDSGPNWKSDIQADVSKSYHRYARLLTTLTNCVGKNFTGAHMTYGAINELSAAQSYRRLIELANHPVLTMILKGIIREESAHTQFYSSVAKIELSKSNTSRRIAYFVVQKFWNPVGFGARSKDLTYYTISNLFGDEEGLEWIDRLVTKRVQQLPGFGSSTKVTRRIREISEDAVRSGVKHSDFSELVAQ